MRQGREIKNELERNAVLLEDPPDDEGGDFERLVERNDESLGHGCFWRIAKDIDIE